MHVSADFELAPYLDREVWCGELEIEDEFVSLARLELVFYDLSETFRLCQSCSTCLDVVRSNPAEWEGRHTVRYIYLCHEHRWYFWTSPTSQFSALAVRPSPAWIPHERHDARCLTVRKLEFSKI